MSNFVAGDLVTPNPAFLEGGFENHVTRGEVYTVSAVKRDGWDFIAEIEKCSNSVCSGSCGWYERRFMLSQEIKLTEAEMASAASMPDDLENFSTRFFA